jgi:hypothetical protein
MVLTKPIFGASFVSKILLSAKDRKTMDKFLSKPKPKAASPLAPAAACVSTPKLTNEEILAKQSLDPFLASTFSHKALGDVWETYDMLDNFTIANAMALSPEGGKVLIVSGNFEIRWGSKATSERMPITPSTGIMQVNMKTGNTRIVRWNDDGVEVKQLEKPSPKRSVSADIATPLKKPKVIPSTSAAASSSSATSCSSEGSPAMNPETSSSSSSSSPVVVSNDNGGSAADSNNSNSSNDIGTVTCCNWEDPTACEDWCEKVLSSINPGSKFVLTYIHKKDPKSSLKYFLLKKYFFLSHN